MGNLEIGHGPVGGPTALAPNRKMVAMDNNLSPFRRGAQENSGGAGDVRVTRAQAW